MVALTGVPLFANYAATKAYDLVLAEGLQHEFKKHGVDVLGLLPGFTHSETMSKMDTSRLPMPIASTSKVVAKALRGLGRRTLVVPGFVPKMMGAMMNLLPRGINTAMMGMTMGRIKWKDAAAEEPNSR
jgi:short-subunit dehydrogenase